MKNKLTDVDNSCNQDNLDDTDGVEEIVSKFEVLIRQKELESRRPRTRNNDFILAKLHEFDLVQRPSVHTNFVDFWTKNKLKFKEVYELSQITNAVPVVKLQWRGHFLRLLLF